SLTVAKLHIHVWILGQPCGDGVQILRPVGDMKSNKSRAWMLGNNLIPLLQQGQLGGKLWAEEAPSGIVHQLFISFVVLIGGQKKSLWVACMDGHWNAQFATLLPNGIETRIVHGEQFAGLVLDAAAHVFEH